MMIGAGPPEEYAQIMAVSGECIARGQPAGTTGELTRLIGRPTTPIVHPLRDRLKTLNQE